MGDRGGSGGRAAHCALTLGLAATSVVAMGTPATTAVPLPPRAAAIDRVPCEGEVGWVSTWASAVPALPVEAPFAAGFTDQTLRQVVHTTAGGTSVRVTLAGPADGPGLRVEAATVALSAEPSGTGPAVLPGSIRPLTFGGDQGVTVRPGERVTSDAVPLRVPADHDLAVSLHFSGPTGRATGRMFSGQTSWVGGAGAGDLTTAEAAGSADAAGPADAAGSADVAESAGSADAAGSAGPHGGDAGFTASTRAYPFAASYFLASVDVLAEGVGGVVLLGDSISDGYGFVWPPDAESVSTDRLYDRLASAATADRRDPCVAVANVALAGNSLLPLVEGWDPGGTGLGRLDRDVLARPGVRVLVVLLGINDLGVGHRRAEEVVAALGQVIDRAHAAGVAVVGATLPPIADVVSPPDPDLEARRQAVNRRVRPGPGSLPYDAVVDVDAALRSPVDPALIDPASSGCAWGDCGRWHPGPAGHEAIAEAFDLETLVRLARAPSERRRSCGTTPNGPADRRDPPCSTGGGRSP